MINYIKNKKREHNYIFCAILLSVIINIIHFAYIIYMTGSLKIALVCIPWLFGQTAGICIISFLSVSIYNKLPVFSKIFSGIFNSLVLMFQIVFISYGLMSLHYISTHEDWDGNNYNNISDYGIAKEKISCSKCIKHFPKEIPSDAKNAYFYMYTNNWFGSEGIFLVFDADKNYIEQEIKKYKYKYIVQPHTDDYNPAFKNKRNSMKINYHDGFEMNESDFTFYAIGSDVALGNSGRAHEYGIGVNEKQNTIIYYYDESD